MFVGAWEAVPFVSTGLGLVAFAIAAALYFFRYKLRQRAEIIRSAKGADKLEAIALTAEQFRVDVSGLSVGKQAEIVLQQIALKRRRELMVTLVVLVIAILLAVIALFAMNPSLSSVFIFPREIPILGANETRLYGPEVRISTSAANTCMSRSARSCVTPEHIKGRLKPGSASWEYKATDPALAYAAVVEDSPEKICIEFKVTTAACEYKNTLVGRGCGFRCKADRIPTQAGQRSDDCGQPMRAG
jgi:hypothetical protein